MPRPRRGTPADIELAKQQCRAVVRRHFADADKASKTGALEHAELEAALAESVGTEWTSAAQRPQLAIIARRGRGRAAAGPGRIGSQAPYSERPAIRPRRTLALVITAAHCWPVNQLWR